MPDQEKLQRMKQLANVLEDILVDGDEFQIVTTKKEVLVTETRSFQFRETHPRLYGRLLSLNGGNGQQQRQHRAASRRPCRRIPPVNCSSELPA